MSITLETPVCSPAAENEESDIRWLAMLILHACTLIANSVRRRYGLPRGVKCPRCGHRH